MIELPAAACIRLVKWFDGQQDALLRLANHGAPFGGVVVDLFVRFSACERGLTPAFVSGPYDAIDAVAASRVRDAYTLELVPRTEHVAGPDPDIPPLPKDPWPDVSAMNPAQRRTAVRNAVFQSWREGSDSWNENGPNRLPEQPDGLDPLSLFLARITIPTTAESAGAARPVRDLTKPVVVDEDQRPLVYPVSALARMLGL
jgi:hypothetical protein